MLYRKHGKWAELATALKALIGLVRSKAAQARLHRQLARVAGEHLGDQKTAHEHYEKALELQPDDVTTLHAFARLLGEAGKWARAVELREHAAKSAAGTRAAALLCEIGDIYEKRLSRRRLGAPLVRARARARRQVHGGAGGAGDAAPAAQAARAICSRSCGASSSWRPIAIGSSSCTSRWRARPTGRRRRSQGGARRLSRGAADRSGQRGGAVGARAAVPARGQLGRAGRGAQARAAQRAHGARVVRGARAPRALGRARRGARGGAGAARRAEGDRARGARAGRSLRAAARTIPTRRRGRGIASTRPIRAIRRRRARSSASTSRAGASPIWRRRSSASCSSKRSSEPARRLELWLQLGEIRKSRLSRPESAAEAFENALKVDPNHGDALASLAEIYSALKRGEDLNRVLDMRASATTDPQQRASVLSQKGDLLERNGDLDGALAAYTESFKLDPASRACFTAFERVCYQREKWRQAMELYETAIRLVEVQRSRAYRLADLYARRGQLQLQYLGQPGEAAASYLRVLELDPEADTAQTALERIFSAQSDWPGLIGAYERRAELVRDDVKRVEILRRAARVAAAKLKDAVEAARLVPAAALGRSDRLRRARRARAPLRAHARLGEAGRHPDDAAVAHRRRRRGHRALPAHRADVRRGPARRRSRHRVVSQDPRHRAVAQRGDRGARPLVRRHRALGRARRGHAPADPHRQRPRAKGDPLLQVRLRHGVEVRQGRRRDPLLRRGHQDVAVVLAGGARPARLCTCARKTGRASSRRSSSRPSCGPRTKSAPACSRTSGRSTATSSATRIAPSSITSRRSPSIASACRPTARCSSSTSRATSSSARCRSPSSSRRRSRARAIRSSARSSIASAPSSPRRPAICARRRSRWWSRSRSGPTTSTRSSCSSALCQQAPEAYDFIATFRELEKLYRKRDAGGSLARVLVAQGSLREREYEIESAEQIYLEALRLSPDEYTDRRRAGVACTSGCAASTRRRWCSRRSSGAPRIAALEVVGALSAVRDLRRRRDGSGARGHHARGADRGRRRASRARTSGWRRSCTCSAATARRTRRCERLIQLAAAPGATAPPEELARYYDYLGRIAEASGDAAGGGRAYRRAIDLDPSYPPAALSLARRAAAAGDRGQAQNIIDEALKVAETRGPRGRAAAASRHGALLRRHRRSRSAPSTPTARCWRARPRATTIAWRAAELLADRRQHAQPGARGAPARARRRPAPRAGVSPARVGLSALGRSRSRGARRHHAGAARLRGGDRSAADLPRQRQARLAVRGAAAHAPAAAAGAGRVHRGAGRGARDARRGLRRAGGARRACRPRRCTTRASRSASSTRSGCSA